MYNFMTVALVSYMYSVDFQPNLNQSVRRKKVIVLSP